MNVKTYRADSMHEALQKVRTELGPDAAVLETRRLGRGLFGWLTGGRRIEVTASAGVNVPSRFSQAPRSPAPSETVEPPAEPPVESLSTEHFRMRAPDRLRLDQLDAGFELEGLSGTAWASLNWECENRETCKARVDASGLSPVR